MTRRNTAFFFCFTCFLTVIFISMGFISQAYSGTVSQIKTEMGLTRLKVIYPQDGATVKETRPMIGADASSLEVSLDPGTVVITINGADVTESSDITPAYIIYQPVEPLAAGNYEIRITAKNVNREDIEPLSWSFKVGVKTTTKQEVAVEEKKSNSTGHYSVSVDNIAAKYTHQSAFDLSGNFREKEGMKINGDLNFNNISSGRSLFFNYHRETQDYTDKEIDKARIEYSDSNSNSLLGHFRLALSDLTVAGTEMAGAKINKEFGKWDMSLFSGRTQDPSTSHSYKQMSNGFRSGYNWNRKQTSYFTLLSAYEKSVLLTAALPELPTKDEIISFQHEYIVEDKHRILFETARNNRKEQNKSSTRDAATYLKAESSYEKIITSLKVYDYGENFVPISEGSAKDLMNDRKGYMGGGSWQTTKNVQVGGEYEQYDTHSTNIRTKRGIAFVGVSAGQIKSLRYQKAKMVSNGSVSEIGSVTGSFIISDTANFSNTRLTAGLQNIDYTGTGVQTKTRLIMSSISTSFRDKMGFSLSYTKNNTDNLLDLSTTDMKNLVLGMNWNIIPFKLMWNGKYEVSSNKGTTSDNNEKQMASTFKYVINDAYTMNFGLGRIAYQDIMSPLLNYKQNIIRAGFDNKF